MTRTAPRAISVENHKNVLYEGRTRRENAYGPTRNAYSPQKQCETILLLQKKWSYDKMLID